MTEQEEVKKETKSDFKIAEIWISGGQIELQAADEFWKNKYEAMKVFDICKDIVVTSKPPKKRIITSETSMSVIDFVRTKLKT